MKIPTYKHGTVYLISMIIILVVLLPLFISIIFSGSGGEFRGALHVERNPKFLNVIDVFNFTARNFHPPYPVINKTLFNVTLVTFLLPKEYKSKYASIVSKDHKVQLYYWNGTNDYILLEEKVKPTKTRSQITMINQSNSITVSNLTVGYYEFQLHPNKNTATDINLIPESLDNGGPTVLVVYAGYTIERYQIINPFSPPVKIFHATASGEFFYIYGVAVTGARNDGSGAWTDSPMVTLCHEELIPDTSQSPVKGFQEKALFALDDCPATTVYYVWPWVSVDLYGNISHPNSPDNCSTSWITLACVCTGISIP